MAARVDASVAGGFDYLKLPDSLETFVSTRLSLYGQVLGVHVAPVLFSSRYTATVSFTPSTTMTTDQLRDLIGDAFTSWNGVLASVTITSAGEPSQLPAESLFSLDTSGLQGLLAIGALVLGLLVLRDVTK